jgi:hypothetical protein
MSLATDVTERSLLVLATRRGRKPRAEAPTIPKTVRLSPAEHARLKQAARINRQKDADFIRDALLTAMEDCLESTPRK